ncbi:NYN domain-containing protein [Nocardioides sp. zg-ZUI104]|uniref:NYN domain-containing protein n=1 Tax=Nocardioides faecalis TaxID=2803858 RepID=UPI001BD15BD4|nr:NYN domain-containing protein [Nocardioides faecalis]MBS4751348.1 NYN domain-containing protein [Nocardioides faecalis]
MSPRKPPGSVLVVDGANVVGARPDGWWKDRAGAARRLHEELLVADVDQDVVVLVLEGQAKAGVRAGRDAHVRTVHAARDGDAAIVEEARRAVEAGSRVVVVTADRALDARVHGVGATTMSPTWLLSRL